jgi:L-seryl-tRNA(Ser) seleniumtransferase
MKLEPRLPQLPSLGELLDHPRVKVLVERINRSTLAQRAGSFLDELRTSLAERAGRAETPSLTHLAERLARRLLGEPTASGPVINATGLVLGDEALAPPLAEPALHAMMQLGGEYYRRDGAARRAAQRGLSELVGGEAAWLANTFEGAVTVAAAATAGQREMLLVGDVEAPGPLDWRWIAARAGAVLKTAPALPSADAVSDARAGKDTRKAPAAVVRVPDAGTSNASGIGADLRALAAQGRAVGACVIDVAPVAGVIDPRGYGYQAVAPIKERLADGADLVVVDASGLFGGPACGVVVGRRRWVDQVARHPLAALVEADPLAVAALEAVLRLYRDDAMTPVVYQLPLWQLLSAPLANLEQRAVRLSTLMAESRAADSAACRETESAWRRWSGQTWSAKSWIIELRPSGGDAAQLAAQLSRGPHPIAARAADGAVVLDLRTVFPRWDQQLVAAVDEVGRQR